MNKLLTIFNLFTGLSLLVSSHAWAGCEQLGLCGKTIEMVTISKNSSDNKESESKSKTYFARDGIIYSTYLREGKIIGTRCSTEGVTDIQRCPGSQCPSYLKKLKNYTSETKTHCIATYQENTVTMDEKETSKNQILSPMQNGLQVINEGESNSNTKSVTTIDAVSCSEKGYTDMNGYTKSYGSFYDVYPQVEKTNHNSSVNSSYVTKNCKIVNGNTLR